MFSPYGRLSCPVSYIATSRLRVLRVRSREHLDSEKETATGGSVSSRVHVEACVVCSFELALEFNIFLARLSTHSIT